MSRILVVGNATLDIINVVECYPQEDQEVRAQAQHTKRGGNAANTAVVLAQLGHRCSWAGTLAKEADGVLISEDLQRHGVELDAVHNVNDGKVPTSYINLSRENGSRTIVHYRDLPEYPAEQFTRIPLGQFDWLHFEGRNLEEIEKMMRHAREVAPSLPISLEAEKVRAGLEKLFPLADVVMFSSDYAKHQGAASANEFLQQFGTHYPLDVRLTCTWGEEGAYGLERDGRLLHAPASAPTEVVDTLGAGDVFNAGLIDQLVRGQQLEVAIKAASVLAGKKCGVYGLNNLV
jgi:ketohexokinase